MSDDPFADIMTASPAQGDADPFSDIMQSRRRSARNMPGGGLIPLFARDIARSIIATPVDVARLAGFLTGNEGLQRWGEGANNWINRNVAPEATFADDPIGAALQFGGSALIPMAGLAGPLSRGVTAGARAVLPAAVTASPVAQAAGAGAMRAAELALPGSAPFTARNVALNAGVGVGAGVGVETLQNSAEEQQRARLNPQQAPTPTNGVPVQADPFADIVPPEPPSMAERANDALPWVVGGVAVLSVGAAARAAARATAAQAARASAGGFVEPGTPASMTPMTGLVEGLENGLFNHNAILTNRAEEAVRSGRMTRAQADDMLGTIITHSNETVTSDVLREFWRTGRLPGGMRADVPAELAEAVASLRGRNVNAATGADDFRRFQDLMAATDELDVRAANANRMKQVGTHPVTGAPIMRHDPKWMSNPLGGKMQGVPARSALHDKSDPELHLAVREARRSPEIVALEQKYRNINNSLLDYGQRSGIWSAKEVADMRSMGPNYMHRMISDQVLRRNERAGLNPITKGTERNSPVSERNRGENQGPQRYQDPIMSMEDGIRQTLDFIRRNESIRNVARFMAERPGAQNLSGIGRVLLDRPGTKVREGYVPVSFRDSQGTRYVLELDPTISQGLLPYPRAFVPIANAARMLEQKLTTGPIGFLLGNLQAPASAAMGMIAAAINAPKHLRLGYIDKLVHHYTGGKVNLRAMGVVDPTFGVQIMEAFIRDVVDISAQSIGTSLQRSINDNGFFARAVNTIGTGRAQRMADSFLDHYLRSDQHRMRREGLQAQGLSYAAEGGGLTDYAARLGNLAQMSPEYAARMNYAGFAPDMGSIRSLEQFREYIAVQGARSGAIPGVNALSRAWQGYSKMLDLVANSPQSAIYRANKTAMARNQRGLIGTARSITGDPSQYGGYKITQGILSMIPFGNITMQAGHQMFKAFKREPAAMATRTAMVGTMMSVAMLQSAIFADEEAIKEGREPSAVAHMLTRDSRDAAAAFRFYLPGLDGERSIRVPVEQSFAPLFSAILGSVMSGFDVTNPEFFTERYAPLRDSIHRLIEDGESARMRAAFGVAGGDVPVLGAADAAARILTGSSIENAGNLATGPRIDPVRDADGFDRTLINNDVTDRYTATILETAMGFGGQSFLDLWRTFGMASRTGGVGTGLSAAAQQYGLNIGGGARIVAPAMFGQERRLRNNDIVGETVRRVEQKLDDITKNLGHVRGGEGSIGPSSRLREAPQGGGRAPIQPEMQPVLGQLSRLNASLTRIQQERADVLTTIRSYSGSPLLRADPARMRTETNALAQRVREINTMIYQRIAQAEADLSEETGRRVRIADIDPLQGLDQFMPLR